MESNFSIMDQLNSSGNGKSHKESFKSIHRSFVYGDVPDIFRRMYEVADFVAAKEGLTWIQIKYRQEIPGAQKKEENGATNSQSLELPPSLEEKLFDFVSERREEYIKRMTHLLEIRSASSVLPIPRH